MATRRPHTIKLPQDLSLPLTKPHRNPCSPSSRKYILLCFICSLALLSWSPYWTTPLTKASFFLAGADELVGFFGCKAPIRSFKAGATPQDRPPPLLWSFPGSGNTWFRLVLEMASGIHTGSIYDDRDLVDDLPGEYTCNASLLAVKAHPNISPFDLLSRAFEPGGRFYDAQEGPMLANWHDHEFFPERWPGTRAEHVSRSIAGFAEKCANLTFSRAIVVVRDPYRALWSEYQRVDGWLRCGRGQKCPQHTWTIDAGVFNASHFEEYMLGLAHAWRMQWEEYQRFQDEVNDGQIMFVRYEDFRSRTKRGAALSRILNFIGVPMVAPSADCAFRWSESRNVRRRHKKTDVSFDSAWTEDLPNGGVEMIEDGQLKDEAVGPLAGEEDREGTLICKVWSIVGTEAEIAGYEPPFGLECPKEERSPLYKNLFNHMSV